MFLHKKKKTAKCLQIQSIAHMSFVNKMMLITRSSCVVFEITGFQFFNFHKKVELLWIKT